MAHFAQIDDANTVIEVLVVPDEQEHRGHDYLAHDLGLGGTWLQTSYNSRYGVYIDPTTNRPAEDQTKLYRWTYAQIGYTYDADRDAFILPKPFESWLLNEETCLWDAPVPYPDDGGIYTWDEDSQIWIEDVL